MGRDWWAATINTWVSRSKPCDPFVGAAIQAMITAEDLDFDKVMFEVDAFKVVQDLNGDDEGMEWRGAHLVREGRFSQVNIMLEKYLIFKKSVIDKPMIFSQMSCREQYTEWLCPSLASSPCNIMWSLGNVIYIWVFFWAWSSLKKIRLKRVFFFFFRLKP